MSSYPSGSTRLRWFALLAWIIFLLYASTDSFSIEETSGLIVPILSFLLPWLTPDELQFAHGVCRKAGHVIGYFILGVLAWRAFTAEPGRFARARLLAASVVLAVAVTDELHQSFVPSRTGSVLDIGYDCIGGLTALLLVPRFRNETRSLYSHPVL